MDKRGRVSIARGIRALDLPRRIHTAIVEEGVVVGVVGMVGLPETRIHLEEHAKGRELNLVLLLLHLLERRCPIQHFDTEIEAGFGGFLFENGQHRREGFITARHGE